MKENQEIENESINQKSIRFQGRKSSWYFFLGIVIFIGWLQSYVGSVPPVVYVGCVFFYIMFLYETHMSKKSNEELWYIWEERWSGRKKLYQVRNAFSNGMGYLIPAFLSADIMWSMTIIFLIVAIISGYRNGGKKWEAKEHYLKDFKELTTNKPLVSA
ncbi:hypothetical protein [Halobacillus sp. BBL2006]|uniref:hypothetical protein n=1 Tax=Halobacillus sp. BBL2006 TaxID=1543706 RepID=UPI000541C307|nr:hypothetical protein [Halobacillus sp. BBL2006]KHE71941.1 hypothetical protein LD39_07150 [Halobacillus sp. BBL2006]